MNRADGPEWKLVGQMTAGLEGELAGALVGVLHDALLDGLVGALACHQVGALAGDLVWIVIELAGKLDDELASQQGSQLVGTLADVLAEALDDEQIGAVVDQLVGATGEPDGETCQLVSTGLMLVSTSLMVVGYDEEWALGIAWMLLAAAQRRSGLKSEVVQLD